MTSMALLAALAHFLVIIASGALPLTWKIEGRFFDLFLLDICAHPPTVLKTTAKSVPGYLVRPELPPRPGRFTT